MSLALDPGARVAWSFPRASGDEPMLQGSGCQGREFSPRERG